MRLAINLEEAAEAFGEVIVCDGTPGGMVKTRVKARQYLNTLGRAALFMEKRRT